MTLIELIHTLRDALANDAPLLTWANDTYGRDPSIFVGLDERNPPTESEYPAIHLYPERRSGDLQLGDNEYRLSVVIGIYDDSAGETPPGVPAATELPGVERLENGVTLIVAAITGALTTGLFFRSVTVEYETVEFFPYFIAEIRAAIMRPAEFGA